MNASLPTVLLRVWFQTWSMFLLRSFPYHIPSRGMIRSLWERTKSGGDLCPEGITAVGSKTNLSRFTTRHDEPHDRPKFIPVKGKPLYNLFDRQGKASVERGHTRGPFEKWNRVTISKLLSFLFRGTDARRFRPSSDRRDGNWVCLNADNMVE